MSNSPSHKDPGPETFIPNLPICEDHSEPIPNPFAFKGLLEELGDSDEDEEITIDLAELQAKLSRRTSAIIELAPQARW